MVARRDADRLYLRAVRLLGGLRNGRRRKQPRKPYEQPTRRLRSRLVRARRAALAIASYAATTRAAAARASRRSFDELESDVALRPQDAGEADCSRPSDPGQLGTSHGHPASQAPRQVRRCRLEASDSDGCRQLHGVVPEAAFREVPLARPVLRRPDPTPEPRDCDIRLLAHANRPDTERRTFNLKPGTGLEFDPHAPRRTCLLGGGRLLYARGCTSFAIERVPRSVEQRPRILAAIPDSCDAD